MKSETMFNNKKEEIIFKSDKTSTQIKDLFRKRHKLMIKLGLTFDKIDRGEFKFLK